MSKKIRSFMKKRWIYTDVNNKTYCVVRLYNRKEDMQRDYTKFSGDTTGVMGACCQYTRIKVNADGTESKMKDTGTVYIYSGAVGAGLISHELGHAVLWARSWMKGATGLEGDTGYPIVIDSMEEEEEFLHNLTYAVRQFYTWYWRVEKLFSQKQDKV